jgi:hypothetical protein
VPPRHIDQVLGAPGPPGRAACSLQGTPVRTP